MAETGAVGAPPPAVGGLGCAQGYTALLHWRGGARVYGAGRLSALTDVKWNRSLNDIAEASITVAKPSASPECCDALGQAEPWIHELTLYRDGELVWQGPIRRTIETRDTFVVEAVDVFAWLDHVVNTYVMRFRADGPDLDRRPGPVTKIAETIMRLNLANSPLSIPADWAGILAYVVRQDTPTVITFEKDGTNNTSVWAAYVGDILRELTKRGLTFTTVGRSVVLRGRATNATRALARLSLDHIMGDVQVIRDGTTTATAAWATNQQDVDTATGRTEVMGQFGTAYGRMDSLVHVEEDGDASAAETIAALRHAATADLAGRYPTPIAISIPDGSQLSPNAPVTVNDLVCGERLDVVSTGFCTRVAQGFVITDVAAAWSESGEKIGLSLAPLS